MGWGWGWGDGVGQAVCPTVAVALHHALDQVIAQVEVPQVGKVNQAVDTRDLVKAQDLGLNVGRWMCNGSEKTPVSPRVRESGGPRG